MSQKIFRNFYTLKFDDKELDKSYEDSKMDRSYKFNKFFLISLLLQSIFGCIYVMTNLKLYETFKAVKFLTFTSYFTTFLLIIFLILDLKKIQRKYYLWMQKLAYLLVGILNYNLRIVLVKFLNLDNSVGLYLYIFEILFRLVWMILAFENVLYCFLLNFITIVFAWVLVMSLSSAELSLKYNNTTAYTIGLIFVQLFQYFYERKNKEAFYYNALSKRKADWMIGVFENVNSGFISIKSGKISFINTYLKNLLPKIQKEKNRNFDSNGKSLYNKSIVENVANETMIEIINYSESFLEDPNNIVYILLKMMKVFSQGSKNNLILLGDLNLKHTISYTGNESKFEYLTKFIEMIKDIPDINKFKLIGDKTFQIGQTELYFEVQCRYQTNGDDYELELVFNDVTRTRTIERTNAEFKYKTLFLSKVAHEFRNPLISIAELINQSLDILQNLNEKNESLENNIAQIQSLSNYLLVLTKDLNYFNETQISKKGIIVEPKETNLIEVVDFCTNITEALLLNSNKAGAIKFKVNLEDNKNDKIITDEWRLKQILVNLLSNAVKFTHTGEIILAVSSENLGAETNTKFSVKDTGIGISQQSQNELLNILENSSNKCQNAGLGILIINEIASKLGTKIEIMSSPDIGSHFWFTLGFKMLNEEDNVLPSIMTNLVKDRLSEEDSLDQTIEILETHCYNKIYRRYIDIIDKESNNSIKRNDSIKNIDYYKVNKESLISNPSNLFTIKNNSKVSENHLDFNDFPDIRKKSSKKNTEKICDLRENTQRKSVFSNDENAFNIIVTDDDYLPRQSTVRILNKISKQLDLNFNIIEAEDGIDTINHVYQAWKSGAKIFLILSDENMNFMCGTNSAKIIKQIIDKNKLANIPFYTVSAYGLEYFDKNVFTYVDKILSKPLSLTEAKEIIVHQMNSDNLK